MTMVGNFLFGASGLEVEAFPNITFLSTMQLAYLNGCSYCTEAEYNAAILTPKWFTQTVLH